MPPQHPRRSAQDPSSGLLSSVFTFVSRELGSFVNNATGKSPEEDDEDDEEIDQPEASTSRVTLSDRRSGRTREARTGKVVRHVGRRTAREERLEDVKAVSRRSRSSSRRHSPYSSESDFSIRKRARSETLVPRTSRFGRRRPVRLSEDEEEEELSGSEHSRSASPKPPAVHPLRRERSVVMPGSLFDRSSSLEPSPEPDWERVRFVRFASDTVGPPAIKSPGLPTRSTRYPEESEPRPSHHRRNASPMASRRAHESSIVESSPENDRRRRYSSPEDSPALSRNGEVFDASRPLSEDDRSDSFVVSPRSPVKVQNRPTVDKGKGKERQTYEDKVDLQRGSVHSPSQVPSGDVSYETRMRGKENELLTAKQKEKERDVHESGDNDERQRDKERIQALEEELKKLREELAKRPAMTQPFFIPPPPPPPPPPAGFSSRSEAGQPKLSFMDARASLKHTATPNEKPINPAAYGGASKRKGQPTINVGADKMAAFLTEMKTHRLRRVGATSGSSCVTPAPPSQPAMRVREVGDIGNRSEVMLRPREVMETGNRSEVLFRPSGEDRSFVAPHSRRRSNSIGEKVSSIEAQSQMQTGVKRKRPGDADVEPESSLPLKRRAMDPPLNISTDSSSLASNSVSSSSSGESRIAHLSSSNSALAFARSFPPPPSDSSSTSRILSSTRTETDLTTPSLCSDNEQENGNYEDRPPATPPQSSFAIPQSKNIGVDVPKKSSFKVSRPHEGSLEHDDREMEGYAFERYRDRNRSISSTREVSQDPGAFSRRPQTSPKLLDSPRRPRPPARPKGSRDTLRPVEGGDDDDLLSLSYPMTAMVRPSQFQSIEGSRVRAPDPKESPPLRLPARPPAGTFKLTKLKEMPRSRLPIRQATTSQKVRRPATRESSHASSSTSTSKRRDTLDAEMRRADESFEIDVYGNDNDDDGVELESGTFAAVGTRSRKEGFLAHGGAGGIPVMMGPGNIDGLDDESESDEPRPPSRRTRRRQMGGVGGRSSIGS
ncbi:hypothetical protein DFH11DRAFT_1570632 [Phellopilus nigrolimitatus]|nr:hypothetical protein DFH11DRAFT_1570632 [Phellopilus nigrolimitatus]